MNQYLDLLTWAVENFDTTTPDVLANYVEQVAKICGKSTPQVWHDFISAKSPKKLLSPDPTSTIGQHYYEDAFRYMLKPLPERCIEVIFRLPEGSYVFEREDSSTFTRKFSNL